jgi:hypothetical protein
VSRIFASLAIVASILLALALFLGLSIGDYNETCVKYLAAIKQQPTASGGRQVLKPGPHRSNDVDTLRARLDVQQRRARAHWLTAVLAALVTVLVNCISITYFIGTNRWCKEVADSYNLDRDFVRRSNWIKRKAFPWSFAGVLVILGIIALGAASDPATQRERTLQWVQPHFWAACLGTGVILVSFLNQWANIQAHSELVTAVLDEVRRIRLARGLDVDG